MRVSDAWCGFRVVVRGLIRSIDGVVDLDLGFS